MKKMVLTLFSAVLTVCSLSFAASNQPLINDSMSVSKIPAGSKFVFHRDLISGQKGVSLDHVSYNGRIVIIEPNTMAGFESFSMDFGDRILAGTTFILKTNDMHHLVGITGDEEYRVADELAAGRQAEYHLTKSVNVIMHFDVAYGPNHEKYVDPYNPEGKVNKLMLSDVALLHLWRDMTIGELRKLLSTQGVTLEINYLDNAN